MRLLPRGQRGALLAIYGFARLADDLGDEAQGDRLAALDRLEAELDRAFAGNARHPLLRRLTPAIHERNLPREAFDDLIQANRQDQVVTSYDSFDALLGYCQLSANPVGRLVLHVFGAATPARLVLSDHICSALQIVEHCQDVAEDIARGRVYLPAEDLERFDCPLRDLRSDSASHALRAVLRLQAERARQLILRGEGLVGTLRGGARLAVTGFAAGGHAALDGLERIAFDVLAFSPPRRKRDLLRRGLPLWWRGGGRR